MQGPRFDPARIGSAGSQTELIIPEPLNLSTYTIISLVPTIRSSVPLEVQSQEMKWSTYRTRLEEHHEDDTHIKVHFKFNIK